MKIDDADNPKTGELIAQCSEDLRLERIRLEQQFTRIKGLPSLLSQDWWSNINDIKMSILYLIGDYTHLEGSVASIWQNYKLIKDDFPRLCNKYPHIDPKILFQQVLLLTSCIHPSQKYMFYVILPRFEEHYNKLYGNQCQ